jgi:hypothetical protein
MKKRRLGNPYHINSLEKLGYSDFDLMSSIPKQLSAKLKEQFVIDYGEIKVGFLTVIMGAIFGLN